MAQAIAAEPARLPVRVHFDPLPVRQGSSGAVEGGGKVRVEGPAARLKVGFVVVDPSVSRVVVRGLGAPFSFGREGGITTLETSGGCAKFEIEYSITYHEGTIPEAEIEPMEVAVEVIY